MRPFNRRNVFGDHVANILKEFYTDKLIVDVLASLRCNACGAQGLKAVPRVPGDADYEEGKKRAICCTCGAAQWKPCASCKDGMADGVECVDCGGSGLRGKAGAP